MNETQLRTAQFRAAWCRGREQLRNQQPTLSMLFDAAKFASDSHPGAPPDVTNMTEERQQEFYAWWTQHLTALGARDAYASAIVFFVDSVLKGVLRFYDLIPGATRDFKSGLNGISTPEVFRHTGNNVRHFEEWIHLMGRPRKKREEATVNMAYDTVVAIATVLSRPVPVREHLTLMATNCAWAVLAVISNKRFEGLLSVLRDFMDELIAKTGLQNDPQVLAEVAKEA